MTDVIEYFCSASKAATPLTIIAEDQFTDWLGKAPNRLATWVRANGFAAQTGQLCPIPDGQGNLDSVLVATDRQWDPDVLGDVANRLPSGCYALTNDFNQQQYLDVLTGFALGAYRFDRYRQDGTAKVQLQIPLGFDATRLNATVEAIYLARDLINTPAEDLPPQALGEAAQALAQRHGAECTELIGDALLTNNYPAIHAVGRASVNPPRLIDLRWGATTAPLLTLVGKGVCFDSGGLDLKSASGMRLMKKDMGGAAHVLCLASMIMAVKLPVQLRVLVPAVENSVSANALRPGDVIPSRQGLNIEIDNTDAEGRLVLADALTEACSQNPDLVVDFATLTGAARVAVGTQIAAMFCNNASLATGIEKAAVATADPVCRLPLHQPYRKLIESKIAHLANSAAVPYAGAITAALFLEHFVTATTAWAHFDVMAWNTSSRPGHPEGADVLGVKAVFEYLLQCYDTEK